MSFPIPVVRLIIRDDEGRILILRRANTSHAQGAWCLPGGKVDYGCTVEQAVRQELREETALECASLRLLFYQDSLPPTPGAMHCINFYFECAVTGEIRLNEESAAHAWMAPEELEQFSLAFLNDKAILKFITLQSKSTSEG